MLGRRVDRHREELRVRASQQAAVAELGQWALAGMELDELLDVAAAAAARGFGNEHVAVLELTRDGLGMLARSGVGLPDGVLGGVLPTDFETPLGPSPLQKDLQAASTLSAPIGAPGRHFGTIEAHSRTAHHFSPDDAHFLQAVANVVGAAVDRSRNDDIVRDSEARFRELADTTPALMWMTDSEGDVT